VGAPGRAGPRLPGGVAGAPPAGHAGSGAERAGRPVSPRARADDLHAAFADPEVTVVLAAIGGDHAIELLPHLDYGLLRANPKLFQGYSDVTVLHWAFLRRAGLVTFYGPALLAELGEHPTVLADTDQWLRAAWFGDGPLRFAPADVWTDEFLDWDRRLDLTRPRQLRPSAGWVAIREGVAEGPLVGGCLETICRHLRDSPAWLDLRGAAAVPGDLGGGPRPRPGRRLPGRARPGRRLRADRRAGAGAPLRLRPGVDAAAVGAGRRPDPGPRPAGPRRRRVRPHRSHADPAAGRPGPARRHRQDPGDARAAVTAG
jgi:hypothetical protein